MKAKAPGHRRRFTQAELREECECHCTREHHEDGTGRCWSCFDEERGHQCHGFRKHHEVRA